MKKDDLIERLAAIEHERWADWQKYMHSKLTETQFLNESRVINDGVLSLHTPVLVLDRERYNHWERQIATPYADLSEPEKDSDRREVMRYWPLIVESFANWIETQGQVENEILPIEASSLAGKLRREMTS